MSPSALSSAVPIITVRFKRCPECGDVSLLSAPICSCCDRSFVTTARFTRKKVTYDATSMGVTTSFNTSAYTYGNPSDFLVINHKAAVTAEPDKYNEYSAIVAYCGLGWLGMILNGQRAKGLTVCIAFAAWLILSILVARGSQEKLLFSLIAGVGGYLVALVDVICISNKLKNREKVGTWDWF